MAIRTWTWAVLLLLALLPSCRAAEAPSPRPSADPEVAVDDGLRTGYHFQPPKHWINGNYLIKRVPMCKFFIRP
jgi:beta-fructofuranosidase